MKTAVFAILGAVLSASAALAGGVPATRVLESHLLPATEISGIAWRTDPATRRRELVVVGDRTHEILLVDWDGRDSGGKVPGRLKTRRVDLAPLLAGRGQGPSQWESVFSDSSGRIFIIRESPSSILVVSADLKRVEADFALDLGGSAPNSGGEGLLPLRNGHFLALQEKDPLRIIEFAPPGSAARGYSPGLSIEGGGAFPLPGAKTPAFEPVSTWKLSPRLEAWMEDSSGLNADPKGALYLLGDRKRVIARIGSELRAGQPTLGIERRWELPEEIKKPEGMVFDEKGRPLVAVDSKKLKRPNLFLLSPLR